MSVEQDLDAYFAPYSEAEKFYKEYHLAKQKNGLFQEFLAGIDPSGYAAANFYIPEINQHKKEQFAEMHLFASLKNNISVQKHQRYTPPFCHSHTFFEMIYVWNGVCENTVEGSLLKMRTGDICILAPEVNHIMGVFDDSIIINILIKKTTFHETFFPLLSNDNLLSAFFTKVLYTSQANNYVIFHTDTDNMVRTFLAYLIREALFPPEDDYRDLLLENLLSAVFGYLLRGYGQDAELSGAQHTKLSHIVSILQYIQDHYKTVTLEETAGKFNYNAPYLSKLIKASTGSTFSEFLGEIRYKRACALLTGTNLSVQEIGGLSGFGSAEHFHRTFKRTSGLTPAAYRKQQQGKKDQ